MVVLDFSKDGKDIELTLMRPIDKTEVEASGEGLVNEAEKAAAAPAPTAEDLAVEEMGGFRIRTIIPWLRARARRCAVR